MAKLKSIENLERDADHITEISGGSDYAATRRVIGHHCSQVNRELDWYYAKLPVDSNDDVIHLGDTLEGVDEACSGDVGKVVSVDLQSRPMVTIKTKDDSYITAFPSDFRHVDDPPTPIEQIINDLVDSATSFVCMRKAGIMSVVDYEQALSSIKETCVYSLTQLVVAK